eukprot:1245941-Prymnesium_polylepis.1
MAGGRFVLDDTSALQPQAGGGTLAGGTTGPQALSSTEDLREGGDDLRVETPLEQAVHKVERLRELLDGKHAPRGPLRRPVARRRLSPAVQQIRVRLAHDGGALIPRQQRRERDAREVANAEWRRRQCVGAVKGCGAREAVTPPLKRLGVRGGSGILPQVACEKVLAVAHHRRVQRLVGVSCRPRN